MDAPGGGEGAERRAPQNSYIALYNAAISGDWGTAITVFQQNDLEIEAIISINDDTALHVAVRSGTANNFVRNLLIMMRPEALALRNSFGCTALHEAAKVGNTEAAMAMLEKNPDLLVMADRLNDLPATYAAMYHQKDTLMFLISLQGPFQQLQGFYLLVEVIRSEFFDVALNLVNNYPSLAREFEYGSRCALSYLAEMESAFPSRQSFSGLRKQFKTTIWKVMEHLDPRLKDTSDKKELHKQALELARILCFEMRHLPENGAWRIIQDAFFRAAKHGISEIVEMIMDMYPSTVIGTDNTGSTVMKVAAENRFENVFNLFYTMNDYKHILANAVDHDNNSLMHTCATLAPQERLNLVPGAALQMQRELQWFNEMQSFVPPRLRKLVNDDGKTPKILFTEQHQELKAQGEKWMKETATACSITTALIATVVFAAALTVPGGGSSAELSKKPMFVLFATTNAVSFFSSITSLVMFLSILTSRYAEEDFLHVLPMRLCHGLLSLFVSIAFTLAAFSSGLYLVFQHNITWFIVPVAAFGWLPLATFALQQFPLLFDFFYSTYGPGIFRKETGRVLGRNP